MSDNKQDDIELQRPRMFYREETVVCVTYDATESENSLEDNSKEAVTCSELSSEPPFDPSLESGLSEITGNLSQEELSQEENGIFPCEQQNSEVLSASNQYVEREPEPEDESRVSENQPLLPREQRMCEMCNWYPFVYCVLIICKYFHTYLNVLYTLSKFYYIPDVQIGL